MALYAITVFVFFLQWIERDLY